MKQFIYLLAFAFMNVNASAQQNVAAQQTTINGLTVSVNANKLQISWISNKTEDDAYWEVQASADGKSFSTIGMVMGADPTTNQGNFSFKQQTNKIKPGMKYFRVLHIETADMALASNTISFTK